MPFEITTVMKTGPAQQRKVEGYDVHDGVIDMRVGKVNWIIPLSSADGFIVKEYDEPGTQQGT